MVDRPVDRVERPRDEGVYVPRVQEEKKEKEKFTPYPAREGKQILFATFFSYLKRMFDSFSPSKDLVGKVVDQQMLIKGLLHLKKLFYQLSQEDLSNSPDFATNLSDVWSQLLESFDHFEIIERKNLQNISQFKKMIDQIKNYPPESEHRFGYYLLQHAGKDWLPFPFIEILKQLHVEHQQNPSESTLTKWMALIDEVIDRLKTKFPLPGV